MIRIGIVDPDTSHARAFAQYLSAREDVLLTSVVNYSGVRSSSWIGEFASEYSLHICNSLSDLSEEVGAALVLSVDWEKHLGSAKVLLERDIKILIDKPVCGSLLDVEAFDVLAIQHPAQLFGGSALLHLDEVKRIGEVLVQGGILQLTIYGPRDSYFMGVHSTELLTRLIQPKESTIVESKNGVVRVAESGMTADLVHAENWSIAFQYADELQEWMLPTNNIYDNYLSAFIAFASEKEPLGIRDSLNAVMIELAAKRSEQLSRPVRFSELDKSDKIDSKLFLSSYKPQ